MDVFVCAHGHPIPEVCPACQREEEARAARAAYHPTTLALLEAQAALEDVLQGRDLHTLQRGADPALDAAVMRGGEAAITWLLAGGPDRDAKDAELRKHLGKVWKQRHHPPTQRAMDRRRGAPALQGLPGELRAELSALPPTALAEIARIQERIEARGLVKALGRALEGIGPEMLDPMPVACGGWDLSTVPDVFNQLLDLTQAVAARLDLQVLVRPWSWLGLILQRLLTSPARPLRSQQSDAPVSLMILGPEGVTAHLNLFFPGVPEDRLIAVQRALYDLIAALLDAPPMESA